MASPKRRGQLGGIEQQRLLVAQCHAHAGDDVGGGELHVRAGGERTRHRFIGVQYHLRAAGADLDSAQ